MADVLEKRADLKDPTPMMQQYFAVKDEYPDYILFYRLGDFYEMFFEDAITASRVLELTLTGRDCGEGRRAAMCGVPFHKADVYLGRLVEAGFKVAVCEQTEDPALAKGLVRREVIRVVTPGTITDGSLLSEGQHNYLAAVFYGEHSIGLGFADISTGQIYLTELEGEEREGRLLTELGIYSPSEVILNVSVEACPGVMKYLTAKPCVVSDSLARLFDATSAAALLAECASAKIDPLGDGALPVTVGALLAYIRETQKCEPTFVSEIRVYTAGQYMEMDAATRRNLELTETMRAKEKRGSLLWVLDETETCLGARLLRSWLTRPLVSAPAILHRQSAVAEMVDSFALREEIGACLKGVLDLERLTAKAVYGTANAKDLRAICRSIEPLPELKKAIAAAKSRNVREIAEGLDTLEDLHTLLDGALVDVPPFTVREGGMIREGYNKDVDYLRSIGGDSESILHEIEEKERAATGIKNLRVSSNKVFGFYIEVTRSQTDLVPAHYIRKQTLTGCERYITQELKELESTVLGAADKLCALEYELFASLRDTVAAAAPRLQAAAAAIASLDVYRSLAEVAVRQNYCRPEVDVSDVIEIRDGRHPVVEKFVSDSYFVPNDTDLNTTSRRMMLITGPNMAGKSTYMRQVALIAVLAQIGSFVPARDARIGIVDKVFTRVGASDDLASGQSTFMLEMNEVAGILKNATKRSLIIYDEVGRGTSTYDGMSIARAVVEYTAGKKLGARAMFATHYHELTALEGVCDGVVNYHIVAKKRGDTIQFLRKIVPGATDDSYGIEVAKLAGVPNEVIRRAREVLAEIEAGAGVPAPTAAPAKTREPTYDLLDSLRESEADAVAEKLREVNLDTLTPLEAMNLLFTLKKMLSCS